MYRLEKVFSNSLYWYLLSPNNIIISVFYEGDIYWRGVCNMLNVTLMGE